MKLQRATILRKLKRVRLVAMDVDGVLTDAGMYYSESGDELKKFNTRDGMGIKMLQAAGFVTAFITREKTAIVERRGQKLAVPEVRSEEHTSELQSPCNLVCRLLLEKKKKKTEGGHKTLWVFESPAEAAGTSFL